jgi:hypothetical protein
MVGGAHRVPVLTTGQPAVAGSEVKVALEEHHDVSYAGSGTGSVISTREGSPVTNWSPRARFCLLAAMA